MFTAATKTKGVYKNKKQKFNYWHKPKDCCSRVSGLYSCGLDLVFIHTLGISSLGSHGGKEGIVSRVSWGLRGSRWESLGGSLGSRFV